MPEHADSWFRAHNPHDHPQGWIDLGWDIEKAKASWDSPTGMRAHAEFLYRYWDWLRENPDGSHSYSCAAWRPDVGCSIYEDRPPMCRGYPWYGKPPRDGEIEALECSYWADVPEDQRPVGWVKLNKVQIRARRWAEGLL